MTRTAPALGLRERKKIAARRALQRAALELTAERGLEHVTVEDIAAAAGMSTRTFFNYFSSKEDALVAPDEHRLAQYTSRLIDRPADEAPLQALRAVLAEEMRAQSEDLDLLRLQMSVVEPDPALLPRLVGSFAAVERILAQAVAQRTGTDVDRDAYPMLLAAVATAAVRTALHLWRTSDFQSSLPDLVDDAFVALAAGLPAPQRHA
jgi:AcrR family transcriptional regulator